MTDISDERLLMTDMSETPDGRARRKHQPEVCAAEAIPKRPERRTRSIPTHSLRRRRLVAAAPHHRVRGPFTAPEGAGPRPA